MFISGRTIALCGLAFALTVAAGQVAAQPGYVVVDLGAMAPQDINETGQVAGSYDTGELDFRGFALSHASLWTQVPLGHLSPGLNDLGELGADASSYAYSVDESLEVVGWAHTGDLTEAGIPVAHAFEWSEGVMSDLGSPTGKVFSDARGVNVHGEAVGSESDGFVCHSVLWLPAPAYGFPAGANLLPNLPAFPESRAVGINASGQVVGRSTTACDTPNGHVFLWLPEPAYGLPAGINDLMPAEDDHFIAWAAKIDDAGHVAGTIQSETPGVSVEPFLWSAGTLTKLGSLDDDLWSEAADVNGSGQVVGFAGLGDSRAFLWEGGQLFDLNDLLHDPTGEWTLTRANAINERGLIVGLGERSGSFAGFLLLPILLEDGFESGDTSAWSATLP